MSRAPRYLTAMKWLVFALAAAAACLYAVKIAANRQYLLGANVLNYRTGQFHFTIIFDDLLALSLAGAAAFFFFYGLEVRANSRAARAVAIALVVTAFELILLFGWLGGITVVSSEALFALAIGALSGWLLTMPDGPGTWLRHVGDAATRSPGWLIVLAGFLLGVAVCHASWVQIYERQSIITDAQSQISQARLLLTGHTAHRISQSLRDSIEIPYALKSVPSFSQFPPGYILALMPAIGAGLPAQIVCTLFGGVMVALAAWLAIRIAGPAVGWAVVFLLAGSPWLWMMGGTAMNHVPCTAMLMAAICCWLPLVMNSETKPARLRVIAGGFFLGWAVATRPVTGVAHGVVWGALILILIALSLRRGAPEWVRVFPRRVIPWAIAGMIVPAAVFMVYNAQTTGTPFKMAYAANNPAGHVLGFRSSGPVPYSPSDAADHLAATAVSLNGLLFGWFIGSWIALLVWWKRTRLGRAEWVIVGLIAAQIFIYSLYHFFDLFVGPRFLFELLPLFAILCALGLAPELKRGGAIGGATLIIILLFACGSLGPILSKQKDKYYSIVSRGLRVEEFMNKLGPRSRPTVVVIDSPYNELIGRWFPAIGSEPPIYFIENSKVARARSLPELQGFQWVEFGRLTAEPDSE